MTEPKQTTLELGNSSSEISQAAMLLRAGELVAFATETVYGLGADATNGEAVAAIYTAKGRPSFNPLIAHVASIEAAKDLVLWNAWAEKLAQGFWPGPLTLVLPIRPGSPVSSLVTAGLDTLAVRVPAQTVARQLLNEVGGPVAAPSANPSGRISPTAAAHVYAGLSGRIAAVLDDGPCRVGLESTIVGLAGELPMLLRPGGLSSDDIEHCLGEPLQQRDTSDPLTAPGQLLSHYAPNAQMRLQAKNAHNDEVLLGFGAIPCDLNLSVSGNLSEAAANLFGHLHKLDKQGKPIAVSPIPEVGLGVAINDRLRRAAAPRE